MICSGKVNTKVKVTMIREHGRNKRSQNILNKPPKPPYLFLLCCVVSFDGEHYLNNASPSGLSAEPSGEGTEHTPIGSFQRELSELKREMQPMMGYQY
jgi:hypothetical protein